MTPGEFKEVAKAMREYGVSYFKTQEFQIQLEKLPVPDPKDLSLLASLEDKYQKAMKEPLEKATSILKMDDSSLVDHLFPAPVQESEFEGR
jgi:hypothetical protein